MMSEQMRMQERELEESFFSWVKNNKGHKRSKIYPMSFVMYSTTWCGYCKRLKSQLADLGVTFEEINIEEVPGTAEIVEKVNGGNQVVPTLVFSDGTAMTNPSAKAVVEKLATL
jgi:mycoredoxin